jgi:hypothetical protein
MKSIIPDPAQLDELAAGLDAGWDDDAADEPAQASPSQAPHSTPLPEALDALDADWDVAAKAATPAAARSAQARATHPRASQARPSPNRALGVTAPAGAAPVLVSKQERREAERKRRAHEAQQRAANKKERKAERQAEARKASEHQRAAEQQALAERRARPASARQRRPVSSEDKGAQSAKRAAKRERRAAPLEREVPSPTKAQPTVAVTTKGNSPKFLVPLFVVLAAVFAVSLGFALSRMR